MLNHALCSINQSLLVIGMKRALLCVGVYWHTVEGRSHREDCAQCILRVERLMISHWFSQALQSMHEVRKVSMLQFLCNINAPYSSLFSQTCSFQFPHLKLLMYVPCNKGFGVGGWGSAQITHLCCGLVPAYNELWEGCQSPNVVTLALNDFHRTYCDRRRREAIRCSRAQGNNC